jgi:hypothetical protein
MGTGYRPLPILQNSLDCPGLNEYPIKGLMESKKGFIATLNDLQT